MEFDQAPPPLPVELWKDVFQLSVDPFPDFQESIQTFVREHLGNTEGQPIHGQDPRLLDGEFVRSVVSDVLRKPMLDRLKLLHVCKFWTEIVKQHCSALWTQIFLVPGRVHLANLFWELSNTGTRPLQLYLIAQVLHDFTTAEVDEIAVLISGCGGRVTKCFIDVDLQLVHVAEHVREVYDDVEQRLQTGPSSSSHYALVDWKNFSTTLVSKLPSLKELCLTTFYPIQWPELLIIFDKIGKNLTTLYLEAEIESQLGELDKSNLSHVSTKLPRLEKISLVYYPSPIVACFVSLPGLPRLKVLHKDVPVGEWAEIRHHR